MRKLSDRSNVFKSIIAKAQAKASYDDNQRLDEPLAYHLVDEEDELSTQSHLCGRVIDINVLPDRKIIVVQQGRRRVAQRVAANHDMTVTVGQIIKKGEVIAKSSEQYSLSDSFELTPPTFNELKTIAENYIQQGYVQNAIDAYCAALAMKNDQEDLLKTILKLSVTHDCTRDYHPRVGLLVLGFYNDFLSDFSAAVNPIATLEYCIKLEQYRALLDMDTHGFQFHQPIISKLEDCSRYAITGHERWYNVWSEIIAIHQKHNPGATGFFIHMLKQQGQLARKKPTLMEEHLLKTLSVYEDSAVSSEDKFSLFIYSLILFSDNPQLKGKVLDHLNSTSFFSKERSKLSELRELAAALCHQDIDDALLSFEKYAKPLDIDSAGKEALVREFVPEHTIESLTARKQWIKRLCDSSNNTDINEKINLALEQIYPLQTRWMQTKKDFIQRLVQLRNNLSGDDHLLLTLIVEFQGKFREGSNSRFLSRLLDIQSLLRIDECAAFANHINNQSHNQKQLNPAHRKEPVKAIAPHCNNHPSSFFSELALPSAPPVLLGEVESVSESAQPGDPLVLLGEVVAAALVQKTSRQAMKQSNSFLNPVHPYRSVPDGDVNGSGESKTNAGVQPFLHSGYHQASKP